MNASHRLTPIAVVTLLTTSMPTMASDMPAMPHSYWGAVLMLLLFGFPFSLVLYPALLLVPLFLIRNIVSRERKKGIADYPAQHARSRTWRNWTLISLVPWGLVGLWLLYDLATNKSF